MESDAGRLHSFSRKSLGNAKNSKSIARHGSRKRLLIHKKNSGSRDEGTRPTTHITPHNCSQASLAKVKRPPLSNFSLMRSQSNLSLYKRDISFKEADKSSGGGIDQKSIDGYFNSPDLSLKSAKVKMGSQTGKYIKEKSIGLLEKGKENISQNTSLNCLVQRPEGNYISNNNHLVSQQYLSGSKLK